MNILKVTTLPVELEPDAIYIVSVPSTTTFRLYVTNIDGQVAYEHYNQLSSGDIASLTANLLKAGGSSYVWQSTKLPLDPEIYSRSGNAADYTVTINNFRNLTFTSGVNRQAYADFIVPLDFYPSSNIYPHIHWSPLNNTSGVVVWGLEWSVCRPGQTERFSTSTTIYKNATVTTADYDRHMLTKFDDVNAIPASVLSPDACLKFRIFRNGSAAADTYEDSVGAMALGIYYQVSKFGATSKP